MRIKRKNYSLLLKNNEMFPHRINMQLLKVIERNNIEIGIWERGAGCTLASGSSACAATAAAHKLGPVGNQINVKMPGGSLLIESATTKKYVWPVLLKEYSRVTFTRT